MRLACRELGLKYGTMQHRRRVHPGFAAEVAAAIVFAQAALGEAQDGRERKDPSPARLARTLPREGGRVLGRLAANR